jgi:hypothetical protein
VTIKVFLQVVFDNGFAFAKSKRYHLSMSKIKIFFLFIVPIILGTVAAFVTFRMNNINVQVKGAHILVPVLTQTPTPTPTQTPTPTLTPTPTATPTITPTPTLIILSEYLDGLFNKYCTEYGVDSIGKELLKKIANCESHFNTGVVSQNGKYAGMFQFDENTWTSVRNSMGQNPDQNLRFSADESIKTAAYMAHLGRFSSWPNCSK